MAERGAAPAEAAARAPGRVNLIGDHTDYCGGVALPIAVDLGIEARRTPGPGPGLAVSSTELAGTFRLLPDRTVPGPDAPSWSRYVAAVAAVAPPLPVPDGRLQLSGDLPVGAGLSSSAALCVAVALVLGADLDPVALAMREQAAEELAGVAVGLMDPLVIAGAQAGHALYLDFTTLERRPVPVPASLEVLVVHSGVERDLRTSPYAARREECAAAARLIGPLSTATAGDVATITDPVLRRRARHVVTECDRVRAMTEALADGDLGRAGTLLTESHRSLRDDFSVSVPAVDELVALLARLPGVHGARMTGGGFGGCVVAFTEPGAVDVGRWPGRTWRVAAAGGAQVVRPSG